MSELENATRTIPVHVKNSTWLNFSQFMEHSSALQFETNQRLDQIVGLLAELKQTPATVTKLATEAGDHIDLATRDRGFITIAIDGGSEEFDGDVVVLYQARKDGEFVPALLIDGDGVEVAKTASKSAFYKVVAPQGQTIRAILSRYSHGNIYITITATHTGAT